MRHPTPTRREGAGPPLVKERFEPEPGLVVAGKYRVERVIGEGGMGVVVAATHVELDPQVAVKFLLPEAMRHPEVVERFLREAKVAAKVKSEHVARVTDVGKVEPGGVPFIVMEYLARRGPRGDDRRWRQLAHGVRHRVELQVRPTCSKSRRSTSSSSSVLASAQVRPAEAARAR